MRKIAKCMAAVCALALFGALLAGCSGQASSSGSASSASGQQSTEELFAELQGLGNDYKSVTMDMKGSVKVDYAAMTGTDDAAASESASAASAEASGSSESASSTEMEIPMNINAKCDLSSDPAKMYITMDLLGQNIEMYVTGDNAVMVMSGQAIGATLEELNMGQYGSIESIMKSQGGDIDQYKDAIESIEKTTEGGETVYKVVCDPSKMASSGETSDTLSQLGTGIGALESAELTYRVGADGKLSAVDINIAGKGYSSVIESTLYDYDATVVPDAPEPTVQYSDILGGGAGAASAAADSEAAEEASSASAEAA